MPRLRVAEAAEKDILEILAYTEREFGELARHRYEWLISVALSDLAEDPQRRGTRRLPELGSSIQTYHLRHSRERAHTGSGGVRHPRHFILYRLPHSEIVEIVRVLHDVMDLKTHLRQDPDE